MVNLFYICDIIIFEALTENISQNYELLVKQV